MLSRLSGILIEKQPPSIVLEVQGGVGYEIQLPMNCFYQLPEVGQSTVIFTHLWIREDAQQLYGFHDKSTRALFRTLVRVSGVGPKLALAILSGMSALQFTQAVECGDHAALAKLPGIGRKTAERLVVELREHCQRLASEIPPTTTLPDGAAVSRPHPQRTAAEQAAVAALITLGYKSHEANHMVARVGQPAADCEFLIRQALKGVL